MNILSIDFDYFIDTDSRTRDAMFPYAEDADPQIVKKLWEKAYQQYPQLQSIGTIPAYDTFCEALPSLQKPGAISHTADSHKEIYPFILSHCSPETEKTFRLFHIDFHHDNYCMYGNTLTCANWLRHLARHFPCSTQNVIWIRRTDSETQSLEGDFPYAASTSLACVFQEQFDLIFLCLSPEWTPPHLLPQYKKMAALL